MLEDLVGQRAAVVAAEDRRVLVTHHVECEDASVREEFRVRVEELAQRSDRNADSNGRGHVVRDAFNHTEGAVELEVEPIILVFEDVGLGDIPPPP